MRYFCGGSYCLMYCCCIFAVSSGKHIMYVFIFLVKEFVSVHLHLRIEIQIFFFSLDDEKH